MLRRLHKTFSDARVRSGSHALAHSTRVGTDEFGFGNDVTSRLTPHVGDLGPDWRIDRLDVEGRHFEMIMMRAMPRRRRRTTVAGLTKVIDGGFDVVLPVTAGKALGDAAGMQVVKAPMMKCSTWSIRILHH